MSFARTAALRFAAAPNRISIAVPAGVVSRAFPYVMAVGLTAGILLPGQRISRADLAAPFVYDSDALLILPLVKATVERGSHWRNERLGFPGVQELHDFPVVDHLHFAGVWAVGTVASDPVVAFNVYYLLTYPLTAAAGVFVFRRLGLSGAAGVCGGVLYAFLPYHYRRGESHYFLSAYFVVPFTLLVCLWAARGAAFAGRRRAAFTAVVCLATASAGAYYAFFGCALLAAAGLYAAAAGGGVRKGGGGFGAVALVFAAGVANHAPTIAYQAANGRNSAPHTRPAAEAETFGLKVVQLLLPALDHRSKRLDDLRRKYDTPDRPLLNENESATLGLVGSAGFLFLLAVALSPRRPAWPVGPAAVLVLFAVLVGTVGGFGAVFAQVVSPQVRSLNRIAIYIAFLSLFAACVVVDRGLDRSRWGNFVRWPAFLALTAFGVWDQTPKTWFTPKAAEDRRAAAVVYRGDAAFFAAAEAATPGAAVLCLPYAPWPEDRYEHLRGYLHTTGLKWSHGAMKGRDVDAWLREVCSAPAADIARRAVLRGFDALLYDDRVRDQWHPGPTREELQAVVGPPVLIHPDGRQAYFDLRPYRDRLKNDLGAAFATRAAAEAERVTVLWLSGFTSHEPAGREHRFRWCGESAEVWFVNPTDRPRRVRVGATFAIAQASYADLTLAGVWAEHAAISGVGTRIVSEFVLPPGRHRVTVRCRPAADLRPHWLGEVLRVTDFTIATPDDAN